VRLTVFTGQISRTGLEYQLMGKFTRDINPHCAEIIIKNI
jgi:hypothetical protein